MDSQKYYYFWLFLQYFIKKLLLKYHKLDCDDDGVLQL